MTCPSCGNAGYTGGECSSCSFLAAESSMKKIILMASIFLTTMKTYRYLTIKPEVIFKDDVMTNEFMKSKLESVPIDAYILTPKGLANVLLAINDQYLSLYGQAFSPIYVAANEHGVNCFLNPCVDDDTVEVTKLLTATYSAAKSLVRENWNFEVERDFSPCLPIAKSVEKITSALKAFGIDQTLYGINNEDLRSIDLAKFFYESILTNHLQSSKRQMEVTVNKLTGVKCDFGKYGNDQRPSIAHQAPEQSKAPAVEQ